MSRNPRDTDPIFREFKRGTLNSASANSGDVVTNHRQAVAIALAERDRNSGADRYYGASELRRQERERAKREDMQRKAKMLAEEIARRYGGKK